jgi:hypothetical protein
MSKRATTTNCWASNNSHSQKGVIAISHPAFEQGNFDPSEALWNKREKIAGQLQTQNQQRLT